MKPFRLNFLLLLLMLSWSGLCSIMMKTVDIYPKRARRLNTEKEDESLNLYNNSTLIVHDDESQSNVELSIDGEVKDKDRGDVPVVKEKDNELEGLQTIGYDEPVEETKEAEQREEVKKETQEPVDAQETTIPAATSTKDSPATIEQLIQDAMSGKNGNQPIIVINTGAQPTEAIQQPQPHDTGRPHHISHSAQQPSMNYITIKDIDTLVSTLDTVRDIYEAYYELLPSDDEEDEEKTTLETSVDVLRLYAKLREFAKKVYHNKEKLLQDLVFIHDKIHMIHTSENDMLSFYGLDEKYYEVSTKAAEYRARDEKFDFYFKDINNYTLKFNDRVKEIGVASSDLFKLNSFFEKEIEGFGENNHASEIINVLDKLDKALMMLVRLTDLKTDIENTISVIRNSSMELKELKLQIESDINNMERLIEFYELEKKNREKVQSKGTGIISASLVAIGLAFLL